MTDTPLDALFAQHIETPRPTRVGVAVSGGSDSVALLHLAADWARAYGADLFAATVDHGLRPEAAEEAQHVAALCKALDVPHDTLHWTGWDKTGNLQAAAREARYQLLSDWGRSQRLQEVLIGHTLDDQAETFLIRLTRKSGVEGLSAMRSRFHRHEQAFGRPLLTAHRTALRQYLSERGVAWCDDPSNEDQQYERVRARNALTLLAPLGLDAETLAAVADNMSSARDALDHATREVAARICLIDRGDLLIERDRLLAQPQEIQHRILGAALRWISGAPYGARSDALKRLRDAAAAGHSMTLAGCLASNDAGTLRLSREPAAVATLCSTTAEWDRWRVSGPLQPAMEIRALGGDDLTSISGWRDTGLPRSTLLASPALWTHGTLVAAPLAGFSQGFGAELLPGRAKFALLDR